MARLRHYLAAVRDIIGFIRREKCISFFVLHREQQGRVPSACIARLASTHSSSQRVERERERRRDRIAAASEETTPLIICMSRLVTKSYGHDRNFSLAEEKHRDYDRRKRKRGFASPSDLSVKNHPFINFHPSRIKEKGKRKIVVLEPRAPAATWPPATLRCLNV